MTYVQPTYLEPSQVPQHLRGSYNGKHFKARPCETMTIPSDAGLWDGGSRDTYTYIRLSDGAAVEDALRNAAPWDARRNGERTIELSPGYAVRQHTMFQGKDLGLTFHLHPADVAAMLPAPTAELTAIEKIVLEYTASRKSSYAGKDRRQQYNDDCYWSKKPTISVGDWHAAKATLIGKGLLNKAGAITTAGRNVAR